MSAKIILITGANKGIGFEATRQLAKAGHHVILGARDAAKGEAAAATLKAEGLSVEPQVIDVTDDASIAAAAAAITARHGKLDVLINNAGILLEWQRGLTPETITRADFAETFNTNVFGALATIQAFSPLLEKTKGRIVNVSSTLGSLSDQSNPASAWHSVVVPAYNASKTALNAITVAYAKVLGAKGVSVTSVCPGWVQTDMGTANAPRSVEQGAAILVKIATIDSPPNGGYVDDAGVIAW